MAHNIIGIDFGENNIKVVEISPNIKNLEILSSKKVVYEESCKEALREITEEKNKSDDFWVYGLNNVNVYKKEINLPFKDKAKINKILPFQLEKKLFFKLNSAHIDSYYDINKKEKKTKVYNYIVKDEDFNSFWKSIKGAPIKLRAVLPDTLAYRYLYHLTDSKEGFFIDMGARKTRVLFFKGNNTLIDRTILIGGDDIDKDIAKAFNVELKMAKEAKEKIAKIFESETGEESKIVIEKIIKEKIDKIIDSVSLELKRFDTKDAKFYLIGGLAKIKNIDEYFRDKLDIYIEKNTPWKDPSFALAVGYALRETAHVRDFRLNFLKGKYELRSSKGVFSGLLLRVAIFLLILIALFFTERTIYYKSLKSKVSKMEQNTLKLSQKLIKDDFDNPVQLLSIISDSKGVDKKKMIPDKTAFDHLDKISKLFLDNKVKLDVKSFNLTDKQIILDTELDTIEDIDKVVATLHKDKCYKDIKKGKSKNIKKTDRIRIKLTINKTDC